MHSIVTTLVKTRFPAHQSCLLIVLILGATTSLMASDRFTEQIRHRLEVLINPGELVAAGNVLYATTVLDDFYQARGFEPLWFKGDRARPSLDRLIDAIAAAHTEGLNPLHYHLPALRRLLAIEARQRGRGQPDPRIRTDIELLASDAFLALAKHYANGKVDPTTVDPGWFLSRDDSVLLPLLEKAGTGESHPGEVLADLLPQQSAYVALREHLALHRTLDDEFEWTPIATKRTMRLGDEGARIATLRKRLLRLGDLGEEYRITEDFDERLEAAVRRFQSRHGLETDGVAGPRTLTELNVPPAQRSAQLRANMERWRWLPDELGPEHILIDIADFSMDVMKQGERVMHQRVIVGKPYRRTPVFAATMTYIVLNPYWEVPDGLATQDQLPRILDDPDYIQRMNFEVLRGWGVEEKLVDPADVEWASLKSSISPYRLRQRPGPENALGRVKFMFPNRHNVYLHDTPARGLFAGERRAFSSGCIRIEAPLELTQWLLSGDGRPHVMDREQIAEIMDQGVDTTVRLPRSIRVFMLYWTAAVEDESRIHYRGDIYERDDPLIEALEMTPPHGALAQSD